MSEKDDLLFSLSSLNKDVKDVDLSLLNGIVENKLSDILHKEFSLRGKTEIKSHADRLQFACPYCRDSATDQWKKRGNLYRADMEFHCYNCGKHTTAVNLFRDFGVDMDNDELVSLYNISQTAKKQFKKQLGSLTDLYIFDAYISYAVSLADYKKMYGLKDITDKTYFIADYLKGRGQMAWDRMAWNPDSEQLYIFNMVDADRFVSYQTRQFKKFSKQKYLTYNLEHILSDMFIDIPEDDNFTEANRLSTFFGLFTVDFNRPISVFEGPLDSFLRTNSVATCSVHKSFPIDIAVQWIFDYDSAGREAAVDMIRSGGEVFLWTKFINEYNVKLNTNRKIDYNDLVMYLKRNGISTNVLYKKEFFSNSQYDIYEI